MGTNPNGPTKNVPGRIGHPITCGGVSVPTHVADAMSTLLRPGGPVPFYRLVRNRFVREIL